MCLISAHIYYNNNIIIVIIIILGKFFQKTKFFTFLHNINNNYKNIRKILSKTQIFYFSLYICKILYIYIHKNLKKTIYINNIYQ